MAALKHQVDAALGGRLASELVAAWPPFPAQRFTIGLADALEPLELLARVGELADRLASSQIAWRARCPPSSRPPRPSSGAAWTRPRSQDG